MYTDLQHTYSREMLVQRHSEPSVDHAVYDHIAKRRYLQSFPTSSAGLDEIFSEGELLRSYRHTLLTSDTESDFEDIWED